MRATYYIFNDEEPTEGWFLHCETEEHNSQKIRSSIEDQIGQLAAFDYSCLANGSYQVLALTEEDFQNLEPSSRYWAIKDTEGKS